jgi:hypothetical protein
MTPFVWSKKTYTEIKKIEREKINKERNKRKKERKKERKVTRWNASQVEKNVREEVNER